MSGFACKNHPERASQWVCTSCFAYFCGECINIQRVGGTGVLQSCRSCGGKCEPVSAPEEKQEEKEKRSFFHLLPEAFAYPFEGSGKIMLVVGAIFFGLLKLLSFIPLAGIIFFLIGTGYFMAYMFRIVDTSAAGKKEMPDWPDLTDFTGDIISPLLTFLGVNLVCFVPAAACLFLFFYYHNPAFMVPCIVLAAAGAFYYPMALLAAGLETNLYFNPAVMAGSIFKVFGAYLVAFGIFVLLWGINLILPRVLMSFSPVLGFVFSGFASFYFTIVEMRILGLIYYSYSDRLKWFD